MRALDCLGYLFGRRQAIETIARSRAALPTGIILVLLTSIARNYDQTWLLENPLRWLFGSLLFSVVSGSVLYAFAWCGMLWRSGERENPGPGSAGGWACFMGLFWLTAPIAWLYAIPVERFLGDVDAARANVALLAAVSLWRVLLMARVFQVLARAPFLMALFWVLVVASAETLVVFFFGGGIAKAVMAGMGGMRNSPAEEVLLRAMGTAFNGALLVFLISLFCALFWPGRLPLASLPVPQPGRLPWKFLLAAAVFWIAVAILPQRELARTVAYQRLIEAGEHRKALEYLNARKPEDFAPARSLPPLPYERSLFEQLPSLIAASTEQDVPWVREHLMRRLDEMATHLGNRWRSRGVLRELPDMSRDEIVRNLKYGITYFKNSPQPFVQILDGIERFPEGRAWITRNGTFFEALAQVAQEASEPRRRRGAQNPKTDLGWTNLAHRLSVLGITNAPSHSPTNAPP